MSYQLSRIAKWRLAVWPGVLVLVAVVAVLAVQNGIEQAKNATTIKSFNEQAKLLTTFPNLREATNGEAYVIGKIIILNKNNGTVDPMYSSLRSDLRANTIDEAKTVVWLSWGEQSVGRYSSGAGAYVYTCSVTIIDRTIPAIVARRDFRGSDPPKSKKGYGAGYGSKPDSEILSYIQNLQQKN